jgi:acetyl-CoA C-acetyltransferase
MNPTSVYVLPGLRSPFGKIDGELAHINAIDLSTPVLQQTVTGEQGPGRNRADQIDLVLWGTVIPTLGISNWGREIWFESGLDTRIPAQGIVQACATSLAAATHAAGQIIAGRNRLVLCGGVESMSHTQIGLSPGLSKKIRRTAMAGSLRRVVQTLAEVRPSDLRISIPKVEERTTQKTMGQHAEEMAKQWSISRDAQDRFAFASHTNTTRNLGSFFQPLLVTPETYPIDHDTIPRADTSPHKLSSLPAVFDKREGTITAGNSSPLTDGAASCWVASEEGQAILPDDLPRVRLVDWQQAAINPNEEGLLIAPAIAIAQLLGRHGLVLEDIELWELHEAFAAQVLCTIEALESPEWIGDRTSLNHVLGDFPRDRVNPNGGSIALGHPFAATGARLLSQTVLELSQHPAGTRSIVSVCAAGGLGHVALLEAI